MTLSPREVFMLGSAMGWVICACCFVLIPSWRYRDVRRLSTKAIIALLTECADELKARAPPGTFDSVDKWIEGLTDAERLALTRQIYDDE
jgi:hypothetical protein